MHELPWVQGPRTPRPVLPRVWAPAHRRPLEVVVLAPFRRLAVHWTGARHVLHFPDICPNCPMWPSHEEHGYAAALVRWADHGGADIESWTHGVAQLTQGPLTQVVYRSSEAWAYTLKRNGGPSSMVTTERRPCPRAVWLQGRAFDPSETLSRLYGPRWKDGQGLAGRLSADGHAKGGAS